MQIEPPVTTPTPVRILVVDDDEANLLAVAELLASIADVECVQSGDQALRRLLNDEFAVVLLDVLMPDLDGYQTADLIRKREKSKHTPIIFLTAIDKEQAHLLQGYDAGAVDYVFKPFDPVILRSKVTVFVELFRKTQEIREKAAFEYQLLQENLRAEKALRHSKQREDAIQHSLPVCFHARSATSPFALLFVSDAAERLMGFPVERLTSDSGFWMDRLHPDDVATLKLALNGTPQAGAYSCEFRWMCADGAYRHFLEQGVVVNGADGDEPEIHGTLLDVTERHQLEDRLMHVERLDAIGKLTGGLAHDFNNLLAAMMCGIGLLERRANLDGDTARIIEITRRAAQQGTELVNRMLAFSRRQSLHPSAVPLPSLAESMTGLVAPVLGGLVRFEFGIDSSIWNVHADATQLELALMNLIFNARDAISSAGTIAIRAQNHKLDAACDDLAAGEYVALLVTDTGSGIPGDLLPKVIEPFFTTKSVGKGTGLGLSSAYGFARQSGGTLRIDSVVGRGTTVELWLPRSTDEFVPATAPMLPKVPSGNSAHDDLMSVLLVDDSADLRELTSQLLRQHGYEVTAARGGAEALAMIEREPQRFDLIVTDFAMPFVSGLDVIRVARSVRADWPAIIITGLADSDAISDRPTDVSVLMKPFSDAALIERITAARHGHGVARA